LDILKDLLFVAKSIVGGKGVTCLEISDFNFAMYSNESRFVIE